MVFASRTLNDWQLWRAFALALAFGLNAVGCGGKGGSSGGGGAPPPVDDPEANTPGTAIVIVPDGAGFAGAINFGGDEDWFTFRDTGASSGSEVLNLFAILIPILPRRRNPYRRFLRECSRYSPTW